MYKRALLACFFWTLFFCQPLLAKEFDLLPLQQKIIKLVQRTDINSAILLSENATFATELANGYKTPEQKSNLRLYNQFMIGSLSQQFTAAALLHALNAKHQTAKNDAEIQEKVQADLSLPISVYLPKAHSIWHAQMPDWANTITLHQLLTHRSGLTNYTDQKSFTDKNDKGEPFFAINHKPYQLIALIKEEPLLFASGSGYSYSNTNYLLIAEILESISQKTYGQYIEENFLIPLQMQASFVSMEGNNQKIRETHSNLVEPIVYDPTQKGNKFRPLHWLVNLSNVKGSGSLVSTVRDLAKWNMALHTTDKILPKPLYDLMIESHAKDKGSEQERYGIGMEETKFGMVYTNQGKIDAFNSILLFMPKRNISIVILSNLDQDPQIEVKNNQKNYLKGFNSIWKLISHAVNQSPSKP